MEYRNYLEKIVLGNFMGINEKLITIKQVVDCKLFKKNNLLILRNKLTSLLS
jgi:hypothetical protein